MRTSCIPVIVSSIARRTQTQKIRLLVLGLGNVLCGDDGLGVIAVDQMLRDFEIPEGVSIIDGGTLGLSLLPLLRDFDAAIFVDAIRSGNAAPGTVIRIDGDEVLRAVRQHLSVHQIGVADLLDAARLTGACPSEIVLLGLVPASIDLGIGLSPVLREQLPRLMESLLQEVANFGFSLSEAERAHPARTRSALDVHGLSQPRSGAA